MSGLTLVLLLFPGSGLDPVWRLNPEARDAFVVDGTLGGPPDGGRLRCLRARGAGALGSGALGTPARTGHPAVNLIGDLGNAFLRGDLRTLIGLPIGGALIGYLLSPRVRELFPADTQSGAV